MSLPDARVKVPKAAKPEEEESRPDARVKIPKTARPVIAARAAKGDTAAQIAADYGMCLIGPPWDSPQRLGLASLPEVVHHTLEHRSRITRRLECLRDEIESCFTLPPSKERDSSTTAHFEHLGDP